MEEEGGIKPKPIGMIVQLPEEFDHIEHLCRCLGIEIGSTYFEPREVKNQLLRLQQDGIKSPWIDDLRRYLSRYCPRKPILERAQADLKKEEQRQKDEEQSRVFAMDEAIVRLDMHGRECEMRGSARDREIEESRERVAFLQKENDQLRRERRIMGKASDMLGS